VPADDGRSVMESYYAARAPEYDRVYLKPERQADLARLRGWLPTLLAGSRLLEVACGTGYWTQCLAPVAREVVALDAAPQTLAIARRRVSGGRVEFIVGDAYRLPFDRGRFTAAFAGFWFSHVPKSRRRDFLGGLGDALQPGSTVLMLDNLYVPGSSTPIAERDDGGDTWQRRTLDDGSMHRVLKNFPGADELVQAIDGLGTEPEFTAVGHYWVFRYKAAQVRNRIPRS
jgi:ubiquinone/menaquinone biosynthesis C-methylase UbiE